MCKANAYQVRLVRVKFQATKLWTPQPQVHAAGALVRMAKVTVGRQFYELTWENWSLQPTLSSSCLAEHCQESKTCRQSMSMAQEQHNNETRNSIPTQFKRGIERVHAIFGHPSWPALIVWATQRSQQFEQRDLLQMRGMSKSSEAQLPRVDEFKVLFALDCFEGKDAMTSFSASSVVERNSMW